MSEAWFLCYVSESTKFPSHAFVDTCWRYRRKSSKFASIVCAENFRCKIQSSKTLVQPYEIRVMCFHRHVSTSVFYATQMKPERPFGRVATWQSKLEQSPYGSLTVPRAHPWTFAAENVLGKSQCQDERFVFHSHCCVSRQLLLRINDASTIYIISTLFSRRVSLPWGFI